MSISALIHNGRFRLGSRRSIAAVALDIGADAIVALRPEEGGGRVRSPIVRPLPAGLVVDGEVVDSAGLADELRALFSEHKLPRDVRVGLAHPRLMVRLIELPATIDGTELDYAVRHLATDLLPVALDQLVIDYRRIGRAPGAASSVAVQRILMAAARVDGIDRLMSALEGAGLRAQGIALSGLAMVSALDHHAMPGKAVLYVQIGALTNVVITEDGQPQLVRAASAGSEAIAAGLAERARISHAEARAHSSALGLGPAIAHGTAAPVADELAANVSKQVRDGLRRVVAEVQSSRGVYAARRDAQPIGAVVVTGAMTTWPGVIEALEHDLHLPVLAAGREGWPHLDNLGVAAERLDVVVGLARSSGSERPDLRPEQVVLFDESTPLTAIARASCGMLALLAVAIVYLVFIASDVRSSREQLARTTTGRVSTEHKAAALQSYDTFAKAALTRRDAVISVASTRFKWDRALTELAEVAPSGVWLTSVKATLAPTTALEGGGTDAPTGSLRGALPVPALELSGCAEREGMVPDYIDRLHTMTGVTDVAFSRSERLPKGSSVAKSSADAGSGDCRNGDSRTARFALVTYFKPNPGQAAVAAPSTGVVAPAAPVAPSPATATTPASGATPSTATGATPSTATGATP
jgi:type IV pilus assembly protein PilM